MDVSLLYKYRNRELSPLEEEEIRQWVAEDIRRKAWLDAFVNYKTDVDVLPDESLRIYRSDFIETLMRKKRANKLRRIYRTMMAGTAASILLFLGAYSLFKYGGLIDNEEYYMSQDWKDVPSDLKKEKSSNKNIRMMVSSGEILSYSELQRHVIPSSATEDIGNASHDNIEVNKKRNELIVGRGAEYSMLLKDGTRVWMNSDSRLSFPSDFGLSERRVTLEGEAYFDVAKDESRPFIVEAHGVSVKVYGTEFNVNARDIEQIRTTLVRGSVSVQIGGEQQETRLTPGLTAEANGETHEMCITQRKTELYTGWKEGKYSFEDISLEELFNEIALWYDIDIHFVNDAVKNEHFTGSLSRNMSLLDILQILQGTTYVSLDLQGRSLKIDKGEIM